MGSYFIEKKDRENIFKVECTATGILLSSQNNTVNFIGQGLVTWREIIRDVSLT
jgi:hypothetical protein